jgi:hypothetical protein
MFAKSGCDVTGQIERNPEKQIVMFGLVNLNEVLFKFNDVGSS